MKIEKVFITCAVMVTAWVILIFQLSSYWDSIRNAPPSVEEVEQDYELGNANPTLEYAGTESITRAYKENTRKKWRSLAIALVSVIVSFVTAYRFRGDWVCGIFCVFFGPVILLFGEEGGYTNVLGGASLDLAKENGTVPEPDWMAIILQFILGAVIGVLLGLALVTRRMQDLFGIDSESTTFAITGAMLLGGGLFMIHGDKLMLQSRVIPTQGIEHNFTSLSFSRAVFFSGVGLIVTAFLVPHF